jgi:hypothetical protein
LGKNSLGPKGAVYEFFVYEAPILD